MPAAIESTAPAGAACSAPARGLGWALGIGLVAALVPLWSAEHLPLVDLPQHAAQVATWHRWGGPGFDYAGVWEVNPRTPYLLPNGLAYLFSHLVDVRDAFRIVLSIAVAGIPLATLLLVRATGGSRWWVLTALPLGYGFAFYWGFVSYLVAVPVALVHLVLVWRFAHEPTVGRGVTLWLLTQLLFFFHVLLFGWAGVVGALVAGVNARNARGLVVRWLPLVAALPLPVAWLWLTRMREASVRQEWVGSFGWRRIEEAPALLVGVDATPTAILLGLSLLLLPILLGGRPSRSAERWLPLGITLLIYLLGPFAIFGTAFVFPRFAILLLPTWLVALEPRVFPRPLRLLPLAVALVVFLDAGATFRRFDTEVAGFARVLAAAEPERRLLYFALDRSGRVVSHPAYLHFGQWYQVEKGGLVDFSFGVFFPNLFRYRSGSQPPLPDGFEWQPARFDFHRHGGELYDYFLVRSTRGEPARDLFSEAPDEVELIARADGGWWLYRRRDVI